MRSPKNRLFASHDAKLSRTEMYKFIDQGRYYLACEAMHDKQYEEAIQMFAQLNCPFSSYQQAQIYRKLAQAEVGQLPKCDITSEIRGKYIALLIKARDALYLTLDRTRGDKNHKLTLGLPDELLEIESKINKLDPEAGGDENISIMSLTSARSDVARDMSMLGCRSLRDDTLGLPADEPLVASTPARQGNSFLHHSMEVNLSSANSQYLSMDASRHLTPSPERLDAQIRSLIVSQDSSMQKLRDDNEELRDELKSQRKLIETLLKELDGFKKDEQKAPAVASTPVLPANAASQPSPQVTSLLHPQYAGAAVPPIPDPHRHLQYPMGPAPAAVPYYPQYRPEYDYMAAAHQGYSQMYAPSAMYQLGGFPGAGATPQQMSPHQQVYPPPQQNHLIGPGANEAEELFPDEEEESFVDEGEDVPQIRGRFAGYQTGQDPFAFSSPTAQSMLQTGYFAASPRGPGSIPGMYSPPVPQPGYFSSPDRTGISRFQVAGRPGLVGAPLNLATSRSNVLPGLAGCVPPTSASDKTGVPLQQVSPALSLR